MEAHQFLIQLVLILVVARLLGEAADYCKVPAVIGELLAGILIGPSILGLIELSTPIYLLAQVGIILLLFEVGLETDVSRLVSAGIKALFVAAGGVILPFAMGFYTCSSLFALPLLPSLFIASTLTATSIGITLRVLRDLKKQSSHQAQIVIGAAVIDDIIGIILLSLLYQFSLAGQVSLIGAGRDLAYITLFLFLSPWAAKCVIVIIEKWAAKSSIPGFLPASVVSLILFFAWLSHAIGAPELLGGFAAGLALSKHFVPSRKNEQFTEQVEKEMKPIIHLFTPIFFVSIGLSLHLNEINWQSPFIWTFTGLLLISAVGGKLLSGFFLQKESLLSRLIIGTAMIPRGEVGLIFANIGLEKGVLKGDLYTSIILVIALTTLFAPFALRSLYNREHVEGF